MLFTFIAVGTTGLILLALAMLIGEIFDIADGLVSPTTLGAGLTVFGAVGVITTALGQGIPVALIASTVAGVLILVAVQLVVKRLRDTEDGVRTTAVGLHGITTTDITTSRGEVSLDDPNELERRLAWSTTPIPADTRIVVVAQSGSRVQVEPAP